MKLKNAVWMTCVLTSGFWTTGCDSKNTSPPIPEDIPFHLTLAQNCDDVQEVLVEALTREIVETRYWYKRDTSHLNNTTIGGPLAFSQRWLESKLMMANGDYVYVLNGHELVILKASPIEEFAILSRTALSSGAAHSMYLKDNKLIILSEVFSSGCKEIVEIQPNGETHIEEYCEGTTESFFGTRVIVADITDPTAPQLERRTDVGGNLSNAKVIDDKLVLITSTNLRPPEVRQILQMADPALPVLSSDPTDAEVDAARAAAWPIFEAEVKALVQTIDVDQKLPRQRSISNDGVPSPVEHLYTCNDIYLRRGSIPELANISVLDVNSNEFNSVAAIGNTLSHISNDFLHRASESVVDRFSFDGDGSLVYLASGKVDGGITSVMEHEGTVRVATVDPYIVPPVDRVGGSILILAEVDGELIETGGLRGLNNMTSARFKDNLAFAAAFSSVSSILSIDLSDMENPRLIGTLELAGYPSIAHELDANHLLVFDDGHSLTESSLKVVEANSTTAPTKIHELTLEDTAGATFRFSAIAYHPETSILSIPFDYENAQNESINTVLVVRAGALEVSEIGRIPQEEGVQSTLIHNGLIFSLSNTLTVHDLELNEVAQTDL